MSYLKRFKLHLGVSWLCGSYCHLFFRTFRRVTISGIRTCKPVWPNSFVGVWIIRASGGFTAANTSGLLTATRTHRQLVLLTVVLCAVRIRSAALKWRVDRCTSLRAFSRQDSATVTLLRLGVRTHQLPVIPRWIYAGTPTGQFITQAEIGRSGGLANGDRFIAVTLRDQNPENADAVGKTWISLNGTSGQFIARNRAQSNVGQLVINVPYSSGTALQGTSGTEYKRDIKDADLSEAVNRIDALRMVNFVYKDDEKNRERFGIIAEEAELVAPQYIKHNREPVADIIDEYGNKIGEETRDRPSIDNNPIVMDLLGYVKDLKLQVDELKRRSQNKQASNKSPQCGLSFIRMEYRRRNPLVAHFRCWRIMARWLLLWLLMRLMRLRFSALAEGKIRPSCTCQGVINLPVIFALINSQLIARHGNDFSFLECVCIPCHSFALGVEKNLLVYWRLPSRSLYDSESSTISVPFCPCLMGSLRISPVIMCFPRSWGVSAPNYKDSMDDFTSCCVFATTSDARFVGFAGVNPPLPQFELKADRNALRGALRQIACKPFETFLAGR
ncbi:tail fiber [Salmonella virus STSR3]|nr:tail fiber [Salmonella virus STSR3]